MIDQIKRMVAVELLYWAARIHPTRTREFILEASKVIEQELRDLRAD